MRRTISNYRNSAHRPSMTLANQNVRVASNQREQPGERRLRTAYPAVGELEVMSMYVLAPEDPDDLGKVEDLLFVEAELELLP